MEVEYAGGFTRDLRRVRSPALRRQIDRRIGELEAASVLSEVSGVRRVGARSGRYYRIRVGNHRLGFALVDSTVVLARFRHRRDFYRSFP